MGSHVLEISLPVLKARSPLLLFGMGPSRMKPGTVQSFRISRVQFLFCQDAAEEERLAGIKRLNEGGMLDLPTRPPISVSQL